MGILNKLFSFLLFIYYAALCLSKATWLEHRYGVAAVSKCLPYFHIDLEFISIITKIDDDFLEFGDKLFFSFDNQIEIDEEFQND